MTRMCSSSIQSVAATGTKPPGAQHAGQHGERELAVRGRGSVREEGPDRVERGPLLGFWRDQQPRVRRDLGDDESTVRRCGGGNAPLLRRAEPSDLAIAGRCAYAVSVRQLPSVSRGPTAALPLTRARPATQSTGRP